MIGLDKSLNTKKTYKYRKEDTARATSLSNYEIYAAAV